jgi:hypothetical protein
VSRSKPKRVEIEVSTSSRGIIQQLNAKHGTGRSCPLPADSGLASPKWQRLAEPAGAEYYGTQQEQRKLNPPKTTPTPRRFRRTRASGGAPKLSAPHLREGSGSGGSRLSERRRRRGSRRHWRSRGRISLAARPDVVGVGGRRGVVKERDAVVVSWTRRRYAYASGT